MTTIFIHLPAYREPELVPTIKDALQQAKNPQNLVFGICHQYCESDQFETLDDYRGDKRFRIVDIPYTEARGLAYARALINDQLLANEDYVLQLDAHHRFSKNWDETLISWHDGLERQGYKPVITGYLPSYSPSKEPDGRANVPWMQRVNYFFEHGTIYIQPILLTDWESQTSPVPSRFVSGHFAFARSEWAREIRHDPNIFFSGEEINLTIRSFTHGYDLFHPHRLVIWHDTMRENRSGKLVWDDMSKTKGRDFLEKESSSRSRIRALLRLENKGHDLTDYDLGTARSLADYERYAGIHFATKSVQEHTFEAKFPPNLQIEDETEWKKSLTRLCGHEVVIRREEFPRNDYDHILVAFDDDQGHAIEQFYISGDDLSRFMQVGEPIMISKRFLTKTYPSRVVYWAHSSDGEWRERKEQKIL